MENILSFCKEKIKHKTGQEYSSACPKCGGNDRFIMWADESRYLCRGCGVKGDLIDFLREFEGYSFSEAAKIAGKELDSQQIKKKIFLPQKWEPKQINYSPCQAYQEKIGAFVAWAHDSLLKNESILVWLETDRGIKLETIKKFKLGWNPIELYRDRKDWGLEKELNEKGYLKKLWLPRGLVIPVFRGDEVFRVKIRRHETQPGDNRYIFVSGGENIPLLAGDGSAYIIVESELDAILLCQEAGWLITAVALGSCSNKPDKLTFELLNRSPRILVSLDSDDAGAKQVYSFWLKNFKQAKRHIPIAKDPTEMKKKGHSLSVWVEIGLGLK